MPGDYIENISSPQEDVCGAISSSNKRTRYFCYIHVFILFKSKTLALLFPCVTVPVFKKIQHWLYAATVAWSGTVKIDQQKRHAKNTNLSMNFEFQRVGKINKNV